LVLENPQTEILRRCAPQNDIITAWATGLGRDRAREEPGLSSWGRHHGRSRSIPGGEGIRTCHPERSEGSRFWEKPKL